MESYVWKLGQKSKLQIMFEVLVKVTFYDLYRYYHVY